MKDEISDLRDALEAKDAALLSELGSLGLPEFMEAWKKVHPEDFPQDGNCLPLPSNVVPTGALEGKK